MSQNEAQLEALRAANETLAKVDFLLTNEHVQWFFKTVLEPRVNTERGNALNVKKSREDRDIAAHRHDALREVTEWLTEQRRDLLNTIAINKRS